MTAPPGWPVDVPPPGAPEWQRKAVAWLLDLCPPDHRGYDVLRKHPVVLARFAADQVRAALAAADHGLATLRADLQRLVPPEVLDAALSVYETEQLRLRRAQRAVELVDQALRGTTFRPRL